ncbi:MAG: sigma-70 family RNA polymerase sigma factor [Acidobacteria bacterium]|nr:sigma-70 family RNA polymerase sigma factor [Acidobacteriota bacterium]
MAKSIWDRMRFAVELDDLVGYGMIGLLHAVERFDPGRGILLKTYAEHRIRGAILDGLREMDWLPRSARQKERQQRETPSDSVAAGDSPVRKLKPAGCGNDRNEMMADTKRAIRLKQCPLPRMESVFPGGNLGDLEKLAESAKAHRRRRDSERNPENLYERKEEYAKLTEAIAHLPRRHQKILKLYYQQELSMKQIGALLEVHESRVSQLHAAALTRLRRDLSGMGSSSPSPCRRPPQRYSATLRERDASKRLTTLQSSSVSTPMVSCTVSTT